jgi:hypothetical protein
MPNCRSRLSRPFHLLSIDFTNSDKSDSYRSAPLNQFLCSRMASPDYRLNTDSFVAALTCTDTDAAGSYVLMYGTECPLSFHARKRTERSCSYREKGSRLIDRIVSSTSRDYLSRFRRKSLATKASPGFNGTVNSSANGMGNRL